MGTLHTRPLLTGIGIALLAVSASAVPAGAADPCTTAGGVAGTGGGGVLTCTFATPNTAGAPFYSLALPSGISAVTITASGAKGGDATSAGGSGATVSGTFAGLDGQTLTVVVGRHGANGGDAGAGGYPNGGNGTANRPAGGGGGSSSITHGAATLMIAGAGGGAGQNGVSDQTVVLPPIKGGIGGASMADGGAGDLSRYPSTRAVALSAAGGKAPVDASGVNGIGGNGGMTANGPNNAPCGGSAGGAGSSGSGGHGGNGGTAFGVSGGGGGGGGGYGGGGGGGGGSYCNARGYIGSGGGGGGGGSSLVDASATSPSVQQGVNAGDGSVVVSYSLLGPTVSGYSAPPLLQGSPFSVTFSQPVKGVTATTFTVVQVGPKAVPGTISCLDASNASVSCTQGPVSEARLTPKKALVAGEYYFININPTSAGVVAFSGGAPVTTWQGYVRAQTEFSYAQYPLKYAWGKVSNAAATGGSYLQDQYPGASESFAFTGTSLDLIMWCGPDRGQASVVITTPGQPDVVQTIDTYSAGAGDKTFSFPSLPSGKHTATVTATGNANAASTDTLIGFDAVRVNGSAFAPTLAATWSDGGGFGYVFTRQKSATTTLFYRGTGVTWNAFVGPNDGRAKVTIDGTLVGTIDLYSPGFSFQNFHLTLPGIADTNHTLKITVLATKQAAASDRIVTLKSITLD